MNSADIIQIFLNDLVQEEEEKLGSKLSEEYQNNCKEIKKSCDVFGETVAITIYDYFESFYNLVDQAPSMLDVDKVISEFKIIRNKGENLKELIDSEVHAPEELHTFLEEYRLTIENRLSAIETEQESRKNQLEAAIEKDIFVDKIDGKDELILNVRHHVKPLIGMNGLLKYQIKQLVETNASVYDKLLAKAKAENKTRVFIRDKNADQLTEEKKQEFLDYIEEDKEIIQEFALNSNPGDEEQQTVLEIGEELACNLVYKICWENEIAIEVEA